MLSGRHVEPTQSMPHMSAPEIVPDTALIAGFGPTITSLARNGMHYLRRKAEVARFVGRRNQVGWVAFTSTMTIPVAR